eukprot:TRINITY_DN11081_c0_g1_i1.p1 TRINITY_DN11081_c0_g1~~TRINITY_DN11081_c0_g1_i1.p1  ORF type:complete len:276 (-),score=44.09 TRINITY_DN11081_c0_g1_i1:62-802(-)
MSDKLTKQYPKKDYVYLFQFPSYQNVNMSPFCTKVELYLRLTKTPFEIVETSDPRKSPTTKLPYIVFDGQSVCDSSKILDLLDNYFKHNLDEGLDNIQKAEGLALQRLIEEHLYFCMKYYWTTDAGWEGWKLFIPKLPPLIGKYFILPSIKQGSKQQCHAHGISRLSDEKILQQAKLDIDAIQEYLGDKKYLFGDKPSTFDCSAFAMLHSIYDLPIPSPLKDYIDTLPKLKDYVERLGTFLNPKSD